MSGSPLSSRLKELILSEALKPGERVTEAGLAERLGVSRTPIRSILPRLAAEGLLRPVGRRGYAVAEFGEQETFDALELRAFCEGWAARTLAERGASAAVLAELDACLADGDRLFEKQRLDIEDEAQYGLMNGRFHQIVVEACGLPLLTDFIARLNRVPFVAPSVIVFDQVGLRHAYDMLFRAHGFHHAIVAALRARDPFRAEMLFREHAKQQQLSMFARRTRRREQQAAPDEPAA